MPPLGRERALAAAIQARAILQENRQLKGPDRAQRNEVQRSPRGRIVGSSLESERRFAVISRGSGDGVAIGMPVRRPRGWSAGSSMRRDRRRVLLVSDRANIVPRDCFAAAAR
jgi:rod shape-determining protein MreC